MPSSDMRWRIKFDQLQTQLRIGIHAHERVRQRVLVNVEVEAFYSAVPQSIEDCVSYDPIYNLVARQWPQRPHVGLLETYVTELLEFIFRMDLRITQARVSLHKPDIFPEAQSVGVEAEWTRTDFEHFTAP